MLTKKYRVFYKYYNSDKIYSATCAVIGTDTADMVEYAWRMSTANVPHTKFVGCEKITAQD